MTWVSRIAAVFLAAGLGALPASAAVHVKIDMTAQRMTVEVDGQALHAWPVSTAAREYSTPTGSFRPYRMHKMWYSRKYDDAPMPHSIFFLAGYAIHATQAVGRLGRPASHGCVRLAPSAAATLYALVQKQGMAATRITITGAPRHEPLIARRTVPAPRVTVAAAPVPVRPVRTSPNLWGGAVVPTRAPMLFPGDRPMSAPARTGRQTWVVRTR